METIATRELNFDSPEVFSEPFPYFVSPEVFSAEMSLEILNWLERSAPWQLVETSFYEQYEFTFNEAQLPDRLSFLREDTILSDLRSVVERLFHVRLICKVDVTAHKLIPGQRIRIHNDFIPRQETHRLLVQLNRRWREEDGGLLMFFNSPDPADINRIFLPTHNCVVGFAITSESYHAVSTIHSGERFTLVFSFYGQEE